MTHYRGAWRKAVEDALLADRRFRDVRLVRPWNQNMSAEDLPALTVTVDREEIVRADKATSQRTCTLTVRVWRTDDDHLDDTLDADSAVIEPVVLSALDRLCWDLEASETQVTFDGQTRVGMVAVSFTVMRHTPIGEPLTED